MNRATLPKLVPMPVETSPGIGPRTYTAQLPEVVPGRHLSVVLSVDDATVLVEIIPRRGETIKVRQQFTDVTKRPYWGTAKPASLSEVSAILREILMGAEVTVTEKFPEVAK